MLCLCVKLVCCCLLLCHVACIWCNATMHVILSLIPGQTEWAQHCTLCCRKAQCDDYATARLRVQAAPVAVPLDPLRCWVQASMALPHTQHDTIWHSTAWHKTTHHAIAGCHCIAQHGIAWHNTAQHNMTQHLIPLLFNIILTMRTCQRCQNMACTCVYHPCKGS